MIRAIAVLVLLTSLPVTLVAQPGNPIQGPIPYEFENALVGNPGVYPAGWTNGGGQFPWRVHAGTTPSANTGPPGNNTQGGTNYLYCETSGPANGSTFIIQAPPILVSGIREPTLSFAYHMLFAGNPDGQLTVEYFDGVQWDQLFTRIGDQGPAWNLESLDIHPTAHTLPVPGNRVLNIRFQFVSGTVGSAFAYDCAIDSVHFGPLEPDWQPNSPNAFFSINGVQTTGQFQAVTNVSTACGPAPLNLLVGSQSGAAFDMYVHAGPGVSLENGGFLIGEGEIVNVDLTVPGSFFLFNGAGGPLPFQAVLAAPNASISLTAQVLVFTPECELGLCLSQAPNLVVQSAVQGAGPATDDSSVEAIFCTPIPFMGTLFNSCHISSNGRLVFGGADTDFSPSVAEGLTDNPFFGSWTDLNPALGGNISFLVSASGLQVLYAQVPYFAEATSGTTLGLAIDPAGVASINVAGMTPNPLTAISISDALFLGITGGNLIGATDSGPTPFSANGVGQNGAATDMIYDFTNFATAITQIPGQNDSITNLQNGQGILRFVPLGPPGAYMWMGQ